MLFRSRFLFGQQAVVRVISVADGVVFCAADRHCRAVAADIIGVILRQCARFALLHQSVQAVIDVARDLAVSSRLCLLAPACIIGICIRRDLVAVVPVFERNDPICLIVAVGLGHAVCVGQTGPVAIRVIGISSLCAPVCIDNLL